MNIHYIKFNKEAKTCVVSLNSLRKDAHFQTFENVAAITTGDGAYTLYPPYTGDTRCPIAVFPINLTVIIYE